MKTFVIVFVHQGGYNSYRSGDYNGYLEFYSVPETIQFLTSNKFEASYFKSSASHNDVGFIFIKTLEYNDRLKEVKKIFTEGYPKELEQSWEYDEYARNCVRKEEGFVTFKKHDEMTSFDYIGGFSHQFSDNLTRYIESGLPFGYIGHGARKVGHDYIIEKEVDSIRVLFDGEEIDKWNLLDMWMTSSDARHWMDYHEDDTLDEFRKSFYEYLYNLMLRSFVYSLDEHTGSLKSTNELIDKYESRIDVEMNPVA